MGWYRCSCGLLKEETPRIGDSIVAIYHLHRSERVDGTCGIVLMEEVPAPPPDREVSDGVEPAAVLAPPIKREIGTEQAPARIEAAPASQEVLPHRIEPLAPLAVPERLPAREGAKERRSISLGQRPRR